MSVDSIESSIQSTATEQYRIRAKRQEQTTQQIQETQRSEQVQQEQSVQAQRAEEVDTYDKANPVGTQAEGVYRYSESSNFTILLFAYSVDGSNVNVVDVACGEKIPNDILAALSDPTVTKWAFNASFERICLSRFLRDNYPQFFTSYQSNDSAVSNYLDPTGWKCSQVWSSYLGFPASLKDVGKALNLDRQKLDEGKDLIKFFCVPIFNNVTDISPARNLPTCDIVKWNTFKEYNRRDVETEHDICQHL